MVNSIILTDEYTSKRLFDNLLTTLVTDGKIDYNYAIMTYHIDHELWWLTSAEILRAASMPGSADNPLVTGAMSLIANTSPSDKEINDFHNSSLDRLAAAVAQRLVHPKRTLRDGTGLETTAPLNCPLIVVHETIVEPGGFAPIVHAVCAEQRRLKLERVEVWVHAGWPGSLRQLDIDSLPPQIPDTSSF